MSITYSVHAECAIDPSIPFNTRVLKKELATLLTSLNVLTPGILDKQVLEQYDEQAGTHLSTTMAYIRLAMDKPKLHHWEGKSVKGGGYLNECMTYFYFKLRVPSLCHILHNSGNG